MALTATEYGYLRQNKLLAGVMDTIVKESPILKKLPFRDAKAKAYDYNVEISMPSVSWIATGGQIIESTGTFDQRTATLYTMIGDSDTDKAEIEMNPNQNPEATDIEARAKAMGHEFEDKFILGRTSTTGGTSEPKGILRMIAELESAATTDLDSGNNSQVIANSATSAALTLAKIDELIDAIRPGKPDLLLMSRRTHRKLTALMRASGSGLVPTDVKEFGLRMNLYDTVPVYVSDWMPENFQDGSGSILTIASYAKATAWADGYNNSMILALKLGEKDVCGLQAGGLTHERETFVENHNVIRNRFRWNVGFATLKKYSAAVLINIDTSA